MKNTILSRVLSIILLFAFVACGGGGNSSGSTSSSSTSSSTSSGDPGSNTPPVANAGLDQEVKIGNVVTLNGQDSSDPDGDNLSYLWSFQSAPSFSAVALDATTSATPSFEPDVPGTYVFQLLVNDGTTDSAASTVSVNVLDRVWTDLQEVERHNDQLELEDLASAGNTTMAIWTEETGAYTVPVSLWVNDHTPGVGWGTPTPIAPDNGGVPILDARISVNAAGEALVVWLEAKSGNACGAGTTRYWLWMRKFTPADGWLPATAIVDNGCRDGVSSYHDFDVAINDQGNALIAWHHDDTSEVRAISYTPDAGWTDPVVIVSKPYPENYTFSMTFDLDFNNNNQGMLILRLDNGQFCQTTANECVITSMYNPADGWSALNEIWTDPVSIGAVDHILDESGKAVVVMQGFAQVFHTKAYSPSTGWMDLPDMQGRILDMDVNQSGQIMLVLVPFYDNPVDITSVVKLSASQFDYVNGWSSPELFATYNYFAQPTPALSVGPKSNATVTWINGRSLYSVRYSPVTGWGDMDIYERGGQFSDVPTMTLLDTDGQGNVTTVFQERDSSTGINSIYSRHFE